MKKLIVACGSGVATSQLIASKVGMLLEKANVDAVVEAVDIKSLDTYIKTADGFISIVNDGINRGIPEFNGIAFLTGVGEDEELQKIIDFLQT
ncbi:PTS sugar transporter subunit IIB [Spiroplasma clarkii]|uniref:PTS system, galactitol-specific IIB component n=1 Tax=Spiroplasma clarkii TaxID=2139 RepID=A0A2K8KIP6_9MOLU|nr:PTS sugar transporter subunit IIB [Spiroplasma clarkii]ATX71112.1 PTS system, galactitol-specific IIB component [Spiroplasma clarkii]